MGRGLAGAWRAEQPLGKRALSSRPARSAGSLTRAHNLFRHTRCPRECSLAKGGCETRDAACWDLLEAAGVRKESSPRGLGTGPARLGGHGLGGRGPLGPLISHAPQVARATLCASWDDEGGTFG